MIRWVIVAAMVGLIAAGGVARFSPAGAEPAAEPAVWRAAGIVPFPRSVLAPPLQLRDLSGKPVDLQQFRGRLVMLYFWATW
jgi:cytochrome oxidase Cu insertion factor (SCO1/SenC/PrrC family)